MPGNVSILSFLDGALVIFHIELDLSSGILRIRFGHLRLISDQVWLLLLKGCSFICNFIFLCFTVLILTVLTSRTALIELSKLISVHGFPLLRTSLEVFISGYESLLFCLIVLTALHDIGRDWLVNRLLFTNTCIFRRLPSHGNSHTGAGWVIYVWRTPCTKLLIL